MLSGLMAHGSRLLLLLEQDELTAAQVQLDHYLAALDAAFQQIPVESSLNTEQEQALLQFQRIHGLMTNAKHLAEDELRQFSKAGRVAGLYKLNAG
ncbi:hypothetical protein [Aeromonas hydrophila]|uniref:hypothetical protein n=1 Tax=Aeromonas hydrophila TaxID=644 RepID=UPI00209CC146|nr:hypothetical protein [Aeromonas hydrophila]MCP1267547.1 hypothetical protein [Aeromonas hydrophila]MCP1296342.1 hypothetical protein [Aeromonas hydrophila]